VLSKDLRRWRPFAAAVVAASFWSVTVHGQTGFRQPSLEGPGGGSRGPLNRLGSVGLGGGFSRFSQASQRPTGLLSVDFSRPGFGFGAQVGGYYASDPALNRGAGAGGALLTPFSRSGLSQVGSLTSPLGGASLGAGPGFFPLPSAGQSGQGLPVSSYMPFSDPSPAAVPAAASEPGEWRISSPEGAVSLGDIMDHRLSFRYRQLLARGWAHFEQGSYQQALACFRTIEEMAKSIAGGAEVNLGLMLGYLADSSYVAAGKQMVTLLQRDADLFSPGRKEVLKHYPNLGLFRTHRENLRGFLVGTKREPTAALVLCYCVWLEGYSREAVELAKSLASQVPNPAPFEYFIERLERSEARATEPVAGT